jgi:hypothetical protein
MSSMNLEHSEPLRDPSTVQALGPIEPAEKGHCSTWKNKGGKKKKRPSSSRDYMYVASRIARDRQGRRMALFLSFHWVETRVSTKPMGCVANEDFQSSPPRCPAWIGSLAPLAIFRKPCENNCEVSKKQKPCSQFHSPKRQPGVTILFGRCVSPNFLGCE